MLPPAQLHSRVKMWLSAVQPLQPAEGRRGAPAFQDRHAGRHSCWGSPALLAQSIGSGEPLQVDYLHRLDPTVAPDILMLLQMAEISRVLEPGGVFVASTFLKTFSPLGQIFGDSAVQSLNDLDRDGGTYKWWTEPELRDITASAGLVNFQRFRRNRFIMLCVQKPGKQ